MKFTHLPIACKCLKVLLVDRTAVAKYRLMKVILLIVMLISGQVQAQFWKKVTNTIGDVAGAAVKVTTAPYQAMANTVQAATGNGGIKDIYKPYVDAAAASGNALNQSAQLVNAPHQYMMQKAQQFASGVGGDAGAFVFDVGTFFQRYSTELGYSAILSTGNFLQGQNPFYIFGAPLAAGIRAARERHYPGSLPLPEHIKSALSNYIPAAILNKARYTTGNVQITLPNFIGQGQKFMGNDGYAVTVMDVIVFNSNPNSSSLNHWAHEIFHIMQYEQMGVEQFAFNYMRDLGRSFENDAQGRANQVTGNNIQFSTSYIMSRTFDMTTQGSTQALSQQNPEVYVTRCIFPQDPNPVMYLVTNYSRIIVVNPADGAWHHIGYIIPSSFPQEACSYWVPNANMRYSIAHTGQIMQYVQARNNFGQPVFNNWGQPVMIWIQIGYVVNL